MDATDRLLAIEAIKQAKARYWNGVDTDNRDMVHSVLAEQCELDYRGCCTDPVSGTDFFPAMNIVLTARDQWQSGGLSGMGIVTAHQGHHADIEILNDNAATGIWSFTDRFFWREPKAYSRLIGHGHYHESYVREDGMWRIKTLRISRIRVEAE